MSDIIRNAESFLGPSGHLTKIAGPIRTAEARRQGARNAFIARPEFQLAAPEQREAVLAERDKTEWLPDVIAAEQAAAETVANARLWIPELEVLAKSEPLPKSPVLERAEQVARYVERAVAAEIVPDAVARMLDEARVLGDLGRLFVTAAAARERIRESVGPGGRRSFYSDALKAALDKADVALSDPADVRTRERAKELIGLVREAATKAQADAEAVRKEEFQQATMAKMRAQGYGF